jgi:predicted ATPase/DNA-binding SARP family transcriptional activator
VLEEPWRITLCGSLTARRGARVLSRFRTQKTGLLLAYLALHPEHRYGREELAELFWYESDSPLSNLRMALPSLRQQLEPPGVGRGAVLEADRTHIGLAAGAVRTDVADFRALLAEARRQREPGIKTQLLRQGIAAIAGELLPGAYMDWALQAREILAEELRSALKELVGLLSADAAEQALPFAMRLVHLDSLDEEANLALMRLLVALKRPAEARRQFERLTLLLRHELDAAPSAETRDLAASLFTSAERPSSASPIAPPSPARPSESPLTGSATPSPASPVVVPSSASVVPRTLSPLPLTLTPFFGREREVEQLHTLLLPAGIFAVSGEELFASPEPWSPRLVTVTGIGGSGKTRLVLEAARTMAVSGEWSVCFAALADADTPEHMVQLVAEAVHANPPAGEAPLEVIVSTLAGRGACLLILDNLEQIVEAAATVIADLLHRLPELTVLATSRQRLNLQGEREFPLLPLRTPEREDTPECLLEFASVRLFVDRAQAARNDFQLTPRNAGSVGALCRRLEGLPLALELAASWAQTLSPAQMLARLDKRFALLRTRLHGIPPRHRALDVCIAWSFRLLGAEVQAFFCRLCLLRGEWTPETAEVVTGDAGALEKLQRLREASFLLAREAPCTDGTALRFRMLESLREFGLERLTESESEAGYERLARCLIELPLPDPFATIDAENIRAAVQWCRSSPTGNLLELPLLNALLNYWRHHGGWLEGRDWLQDALRRHAHEKSVAQRAAWNVLGFLHIMLDADEQGWFCCERARAEAEQADDPERAVRALSNLAVLAVRAKDYDRACLLAEQSLSSALRLGDEPFIASLLNNLGVLQRDQGNVEKAREYFECALNKGREQNLPGLIALCLSNLAGMAFQSGDGLTARELYEESLEIFRTNGERPRVAETLGLLAQVLEAEGDRSQARRVAEESALLWQRLQEG